MPSSDSRPRYCALAEDHAQATVEMAVVTPVLLVLALIVYNAMLFLAASARFDRVAPDVVVAQAASPPSTSEAMASDAVPQITEQLEAAMTGYEVEIEVECIDGGATSEGSMLSLVGGLRTYRCTLRMRPWPSSFPLAGVDMRTPAALLHERSVTIDPWRPGVVM